MTPLTLTLLSAAVPPEKRGLALGAWGGIGGLAVALGPAGRRRGRRGHLLAVDLLAQRPDRARADAARVAEARREPRTQPAARPARGSRWRAPDCSASSGGSFVATRAAGAAPRSCRRLSVGARHSSARSSPGSSAHPRRCCRCASSATARSRSPTSRRCSCSSGCSARSSCWRSSSSSCSSTRRSRPGCGSCPGRRCRWSSRRSRAPCRTGSPARASWPSGLALQAAGLAWLAAVSTPTVAYSRARAAVHRVGHRDGPVLRPGRERDPELRPPDRGRPGIGRQQRDPGARRRLRRRRPRLDLRGARAATDRHRPSRTA